MATVPQVPAQPRVVPIGSITAPEDRAVHLYGLLRGTSRLKLFVDGAAVGLKSAAALVVFAITLVFADAVLAFPAGLRILLDLLCGAAVLGALVLVIREGIRNRYDPLRAARLVESRLGVTDSSFTNAVEFSSTLPRHDSAQLRERTVRIAEERARDISVFDVVSLRRFWMACGWFTAAAVVALASWLLAPRLFGMVVPRYLDPLGDHPPFTLTTFDVEIEPAPVYRGRTATITATLGGPETIEQASVVFVEGNAASTPVPMFRSEDGVFALEIERAEESRRLYIDTPSGRSVTMSLDVVAVPFFEEVMIRYEYPEYTGWRPHERALDRGGLQALAGTEVVVTAKSNLPLRGGQLELHALSERGQGAAAASSSVRTISLTPVSKNSTTVRGRWRLEAGGQMRLTLTAANGAESLEPVEAPVTVIPDNPPRVAIVQPEPHIVVVENWTVPITVEAVDDVGVASLRLFRSVNGWGPTPADLPLETSHPGAVRSETAFDLAALGARAGDVITYYASARDNHPDPPHFTDTPPHLIQVISEEEYVQFARQQFQADELAAEFAGIQEELEELQRSREELLEELESLHKQLEESPDDAALRERMEQAEEQLRKYGEQAEKLAKQLQERAEQLPLYDVEQPYQEMLQRLQKELGEQSQAASGAANALQTMRQQGLNSERQQAFEEALDQLRNEQQPFDQETQEQLSAAAEDLELFQLADGLLQQAERLKSVIQQQRDLANRLQEFQNQPSLSGDDQPRADQLAKEQELLEQELREVVQQLRQAGQAAESRLPRMSESARKLADSIEEMQALEDQQQAAASARAGEGRKSHESAAAAAEKLESLADQCPTCQGAAGEMSGGLDGPLSLDLDRLTNTLQQLSQGRSIPGPPKPGSGSGSGSGSSGSGALGAAGQGGNGEGEAGQAPLWRPGQTFPGSQARMPVLGPRTEVEQQRPQPGGQLGGHERGSFVSGAGGDPLGEAETLTPEARAARAAGGGQLRGVPAPYRRDAEAYFRRMAEDEAQRD